MSLATSYSADFSDVLRATTFACPPGLTTWNGSDPDRRFNVYRNNVIVSLVDALADSYPVVQALVGEDFFRAMAREFVYASPPRSPVLAWYGSEFAEFIENFPPAASLPYLPDVARLEWLRVDAWHAADATALPINELSALLADESRLPDARLALHPALRVVASAHPVVSLWAAHLADDPASALAEIDMTHSEAALLTRPGLDVDIVRIEPEASRFIQSLQAGSSFATAVETAGDFDLVAALGLLIRSGAFVQSVISGSPP